MLGSVLGGARARDLLLYSFKHLFAKSMQRYLRHPEQEQLKHIDTGERFPMFKAHVPERPPSFPPAERPHIFLLLMESFSSDFAQERDEAGREYTPFFNSLIPRGAYHKLFYSNSMQSERGQTATLCSLIPSYRRKVMVSYVQDHLLCLPELLKRTGYLPIWSQGGPDPSFDNIQEFMPKAGFEQIVPMDHRYITAEDYQHFWGWGLQDDRFFLRSQLDVGPSLLEWLGISTESAAAGAAVPFSARDLPSAQHDIPLVQPYDGCYLGTLRYPFKYVQNLASDERRLFDLAQDPREEHDLLPDFGTRAPLPELMAGLSGIYLNQRLLEEDRLVPEGS